MMQIYDPIHGYIELDGLFAHIVNTPEFQRLRSVEQGSFRPVFPGARHDRFAHSLGTYHLATKFAEHFFENLKKDAGIAVKKEERERLSLTFRYAALLHDVGKVPTFTRDETGRGHFYGHAQASAEMADTILRRLKAPTALRERVVFLIDKHMTKLEPDKKLLRRRLAQYGWESVADLLALQWADFTSKGVLGKGPDFSRIDDLLTEIHREDACLSLKDLAVNGRDLMDLGLQGKAVGQMLNLKDLAVKGNDLMALGFTGKAIGRALNDLLEQVLEENLPNDRQALLNWVTVEKD